MKHQFKIEIQMMHALDWLDPFQSFSARLAWMKGESAFPQPAS